MTPACRLSLVVALTLAPCWAGTWGVITWDGAHRTTDAYLSSLVGGEPATGAVRSVPFTIGPDQREYRFQICGHDGQGNTRKQNLVSLLDAQTGEVLRQAQPPGNDAFQPVVWQVADLAGRQVCLRAVDGVADGAFAWFGIKDVPLAGGKVTPFRRRVPPAGWLEETPDGLRPFAVGGNDLPSHLAADWEQQDRQLGLKWDPWDDAQRATLARLRGQSFARAEHLLGDFAADHADAQALAVHRERLAALQAASPAADRVTARHQWQELREALRALALANPRLPARLLYVERFTQQSYPDINVNHHAWGSAPGGDICVLSPRAGDGKVTRLIAGRLGPGNVHGIDLSFDGRRILFAWSQAKAEEPPDGWTVRQATLGLHQTGVVYHLYEMPTDGTGLRQVTDGPWSDLNPCYLPGGRIAFESERCGFELECNELDKDEPTTNLYIAEADGSRPQRLSVTKDGDWYPRVLSDGRIIYSHWEYHERDWSLMHPLWSVFPSGNGADAWFKQHLNLPATLTVPRAVPDSRRIMAIGTGHHTLAAGPIVLVDQRGGLNDAGGVERLTGPDKWPEYNAGPVPPSTRPGWRPAPGDGWYMDPWPLSERAFLAGYCDGAMQDETGYGLYLLDVYGGKELLQRSNDISSVMPVPLAPRPEPPVLADARQTEERDAVLCVANADQGMADVAPGTVKYLRVSEPVPWRYANDRGGLRFEPDAKAGGTSWTAIRVLGTVPVEADGSVQCRVPADTALYFQALDAEFREVRRMRSYVSFQPGERRGCVGCHETKATAPARAKGQPLAFAKQPQTLTPPPWGARPLSFLREVQPVLERRCSGCHSGLRPAGGVDLSGGLTAEHNRAYDTLVPGRTSPWITVSNKHDDARISLPRQFGSGNSRLLAVLADARHRAVALTAEERLRLYTWMDANAVYHDREIDKRPEGGGAEPYNLATDAELWQRVRAVQTRRCAGCHQGVTLARPEWVDLWSPEQTRFLRAPRETCPGHPWAGADADYTATLALVRQAVSQTWQRPRRDLQSLAADHRPE